MKISIIFLIAVVSALSLAIPLIAGDDILVAVSVLPQLEFVEQVASVDLFQFLVLIPPGASPSTYELTPGQMKKLSQTSIYFKLGSGLPFENTWLERIAQLNPEMIIVDCSKGIEKISGAEGDENIHGSHHHHGSDPHIWCSAKNAGLIIDNITGGFIDIDPERESIYEMNAHIYKQKLRELDLEIETLFRDVVKRKFIIFHPSWGYFAKDYDLIQMPIEIEGKEPGAGDLRKLIELSRQEGLSTIFASPQFNTESAEIIAGEIDGAVEYIDHLRKDYLVNLQEVAEKLAKAMN
ncbi:MAG: zinc ABC transporter solute-binding protein [candidate division Zixibacteria bacterium]|nr:zinc ABC transporter solute-binding protein [candidate division Zixibacteria bacterium]